MNGERPDTAPETGGGVLTGLPDGSPTKQTAPALVRRIDRAEAPTKPAPVRAPVTGGTIVAVICLGLVLLGIIGVAFRGSWTAHRDAALAAHFDELGASLYPFAPDGLIVIALIAAMVLRHDRKARLYALAVVGVFTFTSFIVNQLHGLGQFALDSASGALPALPGPVVALIAGQVIGAIFFGSHLIVNALRYLFPGVSAEQAEPATESGAHETTGDTTGRTETATGDRSERVIETVRDPDPEDVAMKVYAILVELNQPVGRDKLATFCGISGRQAVRVRKAVEQDREMAEIQREEEERVAAERAAAELAERLAHAEEIKVQNAEPSPNGSAPASAGASS